MMIKIQLSKGAGLWEITLLLCIFHKTISYTSNPILYVIKRKRENKHILCRNHSLVSSQSNVMYSILYMGLDIPLASRNTPIEIRNGEYSGGTQLISMYWPQPTPKQTSKMEGHNVGDDNLGVTRTYLEVTQLHSLQIHNIFKNHIN